MSLLRRILSPDHLPAKKAKSKSTKSRIKQAVLVALMVPTSILTAHAGNETRIFFLGNSLTDELKYDDFVKLAGAGGEKITWGRQMCPGIPINGLWAMKDKGGFTKEPFGPWGKALAEFEWDILTMQPFGNVFEPQLQAAHNFAVELAKKSPDATVFIYAQWPDRGKPSPMVQTEAAGWDQRFVGEQRYFEPPDWAKKDVEERFFYPSVVAALPPPFNETFKDRSLKHQYEAFVHALNAHNPGNKPVRLIPVGHVMQLLGQKMQAGLVPGYTSLYDFYSDGVHVNNDGSYLVALTFYATMFGKSPVGLPIGEYQGKPGQRDDGVKISDELARIFQETVWEVVASHPLTGVTSAEPLRVASPVLDEGVTGEDYRFELLSAFGKPPYRWSLEGTLPPGLALSPEGVLSGCPETTGTFPVSVKVSDSAGANAERQFDLKMVEPVDPVIPEQSLPRMSVGGFVETRLRSEAGNGAHSWQVAEGGELPPGLTLDTDGRLWGAPGKEGRFEFPVTVTDSKPTHPGKATRILSIEVAPPKGDVAFARRLDIGPKEKPPLEESFWQFRYPINKLVDGGKATIGGAFDVAWTDEALFVAVKIDDATPDKGTWASALTDDNVILCVDAYNNREATYNSDDWYVPYPRGHTFPQRSIVIGPYSGHSCRQKEIEGGYLAVFEVSFNALGLPVPAKPHRTIGLDLMLVDDAEGGAGKSVVVWKGTNDNAKDPSQFGTIILQER